MSKLSFQQRFLPHLLTIAGFLLIVIVYFSPVFLEHKQLDQHDIIQWKGSAEEIEQYRKAFHKEPLWTNSMFGGMPTAFVSTLHYGDILSHVHTVLTLGLPHPVSLIFIMLVSAYLMLLAFDVKPLVASIGAVGFTFASFTFVSIAAGHNAKVMAIAYLPLVIAAVVWAYRKNAWQIGALFGLALALQIRSSHLQITYYLALILVAFGISEFINALKNKTLPGFAKVTVSLAIFGLVGVACNLGQLLTNYEYSKYSIRGKYELKPLDAARTNTEGLDKDYAFDYSNTMDESFTLLVPNFLGGASMSKLDKKSATYKILNERAGAETAEQFTQRVPTYFGQLGFTAGPSYAGAIICFLFVLGMFVVEARWKWWIFGITFLSIMLSWGKYFEVLNYFMFDYFPGYNKFRAVTMALAIAQVTMPLLAALSLDAVLKKTFIEAKKPLIYSLAITGGLCVLFILMASSFAVDASSDDQLRQQAQGEWLVDALKEDRISMVRNDAFRSLVFILLSAGAIVVALMGKIKTNIAVVIVLALAVIDLFSVDKRYLGKDNFKKGVFEENFTPTPADAAILNDKSNYRVLNLQGPFNDARTSYFHKSIGGYCAAKMRRYQDLIERTITPEMQSLIGSLQKGYTPDVFANFPVLNMLNTKYIKAGEEANAVIQNPKALGNAWFVKNLKAVNTPDEEISSLNGLNAATTAVFDKSKFQISKTDFDTTGASVKLLTYQPNALNYEVQSPTGGGFLVFSEVYYEKGWQAKLDGQPVPHQRVNYILRGMEVPAGKHQISFEFHPQVYYTGNNIGLIASILLLLLSVGSGYMLYKKSLEVKG